MGLFDKLIPNPTPERFSRIAIKVLRQLGVRNDLRYDSDKFAIFFDAEGVRTFYLSNAYNEYCRNPYFRRKSQLRKTVALIVHAPPELPTDFENAKPNILPRVRERFHYDFLQMSLQGDNTKMLEIPNASIAGQFSVELAYDFPDSVHSISTDQLNSWNISFEDGLAIARENLWKRSNESFHELSEGVFVSSWQDLHDASRIILHDLIWQLKVKGDHVAMIPNQNILIVTGSEDVQGLLSMASLVSSMIQESYPISTLAVYLKDGKWKDYLPGKNHTARKHFNNLRVQCISDEYSRQHQLLETRYKQKNKDIYVADALVVQEQNTDSTFSFTTWSEGVKTLLPKTDKIGFVSMLDSGKQVTQGVADWDKVYEVLGDLMKPAELHPERYLVSDYPPIDTIKAISDFQV